MHLWCGDKKSGKEMESDEYMTRTSKKRKLVEFTGMAKDEDNMKGESDVPRVRCDAHSLFDRVV